ncbi:MAG: DoxX family protein [Nanoarchaeota archaeon]
MNHKNIMTANRILLGLVMLVPGLLKLFVIGSDAVVGMLSSNVLFSWAPGFWAWVLILSEIVFGIAILASWKLEYTVWPPIVIMLVAAFTVAWGNWPTFLMHLVIASNYLILKKSR